MRRRLTPWIVLLCAACGGRAVPAPDPSIARPDFGAEEIAGVIPATLDEQLALGEEIFVASCAGCHGLDGGGGAGPAIIGAGVLTLEPAPGSGRDEDFDDAAELVSWIRGHVPFDRLSEGAYYDVTAYLLARNRVPLAQPLNEASAERLALAPLLPARAAAAPGS